MIGVETFLRFMVQFSFMVRDVGMILGTKITATENTFRLHDRLEDDIIILLGISYLFGGMSRSGVGTPGRFFYKKCPESDDRTLSEHFYRYRLCYMGRSYNLPQTGLICNTSSVLS